MGKKRRRRKLKKTHQSTKSQSLSSPSRAKIKISEAILTLSEELRRQYREPSRTKAIISLTIMAWNISLFPQEEQNEMQDTVLRSFANQFGQEERTALLQSLDLLIAQKKALYPHIHEFIAKYDVSLSDETISLTVATASISEMRGEATD